MIRAVRKPLSTSLGYSVEILEQRIAPAALIGLDDTNHLLAFDSATPATVVSTPVTGLVAGETLIGIDFRPATGALYGIAKTSAGGGHVYLINPATGAALMSVALAADPTDATSPFSTLSGVSFGVDFNPVADLLRVVSDASQNLRINVDSGLVTTDTPLNPTGSAIAGAAYSNSFAGAGGTTLYDIDVTNDKLVVQAPPNNGTLTNPLPLGIDATGGGGFDILSVRDAAGIVTDTGFAALKVGSTTGLYSINLTTGAASGGTAIGTGVTALRGLTAVIGAPTGQAFTIDSINQHLLSFNTATPGGTPTDLGAITGLGGGESIVGFDFRPNDGQLYLVTKDAANAGHVYTVNTGTAVALATANSLITGTTLTGTDFGVDFNPTNNALRIVDNAGHNLAVDVTTGVATVQPVLNGATAGAQHAAYANNFAGAATTTLYDLNTDTDQLFTQVPTTGVTTLVGALGVDATGVGGFDISTDGHAYATLTVGGTAKLYSINLQTGAATAVGAVNGVTGNTLGLALAPNGSFQFHTPTLTVGEGAGTATLTIDRVGGSEGTSTVLVKTTAGTAGTSDFTAVSKAVTFGPGVTSLNVDIPITQDTLIENSESFTVTLSNPAGGAQLDTNVTSTVTITDDEPAAGAATNLIGLDNANHLILFSSTAQGTITSTLTVTGLGAGETLVGIDFRPATGGLYGLTKDGSNAGRLYVINPATGQASFSMLLAADPTDTSDGNPSYTVLTGTKFGLDFNPAADRLRVVSDAQQDLRINVDTGGVFTDAALNQTTGTPQIGESAYSNSFAGAGSTALYNLDFGSDHLVTQSPPVSGTQVDVGALGVNASSSMGFDIVSSRTPAGVVTNNAFAALNVGGTTGLYAIDLTTGHAGLYGTIGTGTGSLIGLTSSTGAPAADAFTIDAANELVHFSTATPGVALSTKAITGLGAGETIIGFDFRANGVAYLVTKAANSVGHIYSFDANTTDVTVAATPITTIAVTLDGTQFGVDFDPVLDHLRIVSDTGRNYDVNVDTGATEPQNALNPAASVAGAAFSNPFPGGGTVGANTGVTQLFVIDATTDKLMLLQPAAGTLTPVGNLGVDATGIGEFDIRANGEAFAVLTVGGAANLYKINLATGAATLAGAVPSGPSHGFALAPNVVTQFSAGAVTVPEEGGPAVLTINRLDGTAGTSSVIVQTHDGTAAAGSDYTAFSQVVTFAPGEMTKQISIPILNDSIYEGTESFTVTITDQSGDSFNAITTETVTITDNESIPTVSIGDLRQVEGTATVPSTFAFPVTLSGPAQADVTFDFTIVPGTATAADFPTLTGHGKILAGQTTGTVAVGVNADSTFEADETFTVKLGNPSANATILQDTGHGTILNDDANSISAKMVTYTDVDGDLVTVKTTVGTLSGLNFTFVPAGTHGGLQLQKLDLSSPTFINSNVTFTAKRTAAGGDGFVNVGYIDALGNTLGAVSVNGDLGQIDANAAKALGVLSLGKLGVSTQGAGGSLQSTFVFNLPTLIVRTDIVDASISALNFTAATVFGNVVGGAGDHSGSIEAAGRIGALTIGGTLHGGADAESGSVIAKTIGALKIREIDGGRIFVAGNPVGATATAANIKTALALGSLTVGANVRNANILIGYDRTGAPVNADVQTGAISVAGDWEASNLSAGVKAGTDGFYGSDTGAVIPNGGAVVSRIASITVKGQVFGTIANTVDRFGFVAEQIGAFTVGGTKLALGTLATAPKDNVTIGFTDDVRVREY
jgi:hypothetical protein